LQQLAQEHILGAPGSGVTLTLASLGGERKSVTLERR